MPFNPDESTYSPPPSRRWDELTDGEKRDIMRREPQPGLQEVPLERPRQPEISRTPVPSRDKGKSTPVLH